MGPPALPSEQWGQRGQCGDHHTHPGGGVWSQGQWQGDGKGPDPGGKPWLQWWGSTLETQGNLLVPEAVLEADRNNLRGSHGNPGF